MAHARRVAILVTVFLVYFLVFGAIFGWHRLHTDFWPLDQSTDGPNIYASFIWLPIAFVGGWIVAEIRGAKSLERERQLLEEHARQIDAKLDAHHLRMAKLLGVTDQPTADALNSTAGDRQLDSMS